MNELGTIHTEQSLLGACISAGVSPPVSLSDFCVENHRRIAAVMGDIEREGGTPDLVAVGLRVYEKCKGELTASDVVQICEATGGEKNIPIYAKIIQDHANARRMRVQAESFLAELGSPNGKKPAEVAANFRRNMLSCDVGAFSETEGHTMKSGMAEMIERIDERKKNGSKVPGVSTGFPELDEITCGMWAQDMWVLAARPGQGKTALCLNITTAVAKEGRHVLWFSLDMSREKLWERLLCTESKINLAKIRSGNLTDQDYKRVIDSAMTLQHLPITILDKPCTELDVLRQAKAIQPRLIVIDYLTKIRPSANSGNANYDYGLISKLVKNMAKEMDIPVLLICQLNRTNERESRPPREYDLRDSGEIEQDADTIIFIHSKDKSQPERDLLIAKQRQGELAVLKFYFLGGVQKFEQYVKGA
jgi:replicative DNA helicase